MKILHFGRFLQEGFQKLGCEVAHLPIDPGKSINQLVDESGVAPDVVFLELFGRTDLPRALHECRHRLAAYCVDSPINEYWLVPLMKLFDFVYVDQLSSVPRFRKAGVQAAWLPLCVSESDFRQPGEEKHFLTFVGRITQHRPKRANLIEHISQRCELNRVEGVTRAEMLDLFAQSRAVLNENLFPGLNLRFFQALASGSLLFTERRSYGVKRFFEEGRHYVGYSPEDIAEGIEALRERREELEDVARQGQEECRARHTSVHRAQSVLQDLAGRGARRRPLVHDLKVEEGHGKYMHALRFGGYVGEAAELLQAPESAENRAMAQHLLGNILLRLGRVEQAAEQFLLSCSQATPYGLRSALKLMMLTQDSRPQLLQALTRVLSLLRAMGRDVTPYAACVRELGEGRDTRLNCCMLGCAVLRDIDCVSALGLLKEYEERFPDYALEYAILAFRERMDPASLQAVIDCTRKAGVPTDALPFIKQAILKLAASDEQIALSAALARECYDFPYALSVSGAFRRLLQSRAAADQPGQRE